jgi:hypothetical protein
MSLVRIKKSTWPASAFDIWQRCMVLPIFENLYWHLGTNIITNFNFWDFELCSFVLSWFFCKFIPPFSFCFSKNSSFQNSFNNYLSTNINIHCLYIFGLLFLLENEKKLVFVDFSLLSQPNSQHRGILSLIIYQLLCIMIMYGRWTNKTGTLKI